MQSLLNRRDMSVQSAYVITLENNDISAALSGRCQASCVAIQQAVTPWPGFDATSGVIQCPPQLQDQMWWQWIKVYDHFQSPTEVACSLSHISLWAHCMTIDQPIIVLEHDAVMTKKLQHHRFYNTVQYLGCAQQREFDIARGDAVPWSSINQNWIFINRAHAYSIDPAAARRLFGMVLERGIFESLDVMIMADAVAIVQDGVYAYDDPVGVTTITDRKQTGQHGPGEIRI
jgi:hypothetical protein